MSERPYITERTQLWRAREIKPWFVEAIGTIEESGHQVLSVSGDQITQGFTYSTGVYDTCGKPEIVTVGLPYKVAASAINEAIRRMHAGVDLTQGRHTDILGNVEVEFQPVDSKWLHHIMLRTHWYYEGMDVPVLQLIYPDLRNRFPDEADFDETFGQPKLHGPVEHGTSEADLWAAHDPASSISRWKFTDPPHTTSYLSKSVANDEEAVTYVSHDVDGDWQFLGDKMDSGGGPVISCLHHPIDRDRSIEELHDLPLGWYAVRTKPGELWKRFEHPPDEADGQLSVPPLLN